MPALLVDIIIDVYSVSVLENNASATSHKSSTLLPMNAVCRSSRVAREFYIVTNRQDEECAESPLDRLPASDAERLSWIAIHPGPIGEVPFMGPDRMTRAYQFYWPCLLLRYFFDATRGSLQLTQGHLGPQISDDSIGRSSERGF
jgi:hypothetical protein